MNATTSGAGSSPDANGRWVIRWHPPCETVMWMIPWPHPLLVKDARPGRIVGPESGISEGVCPPKLSTFFSGPTDHASNPDVAVRSWRTAYSGVMRPDTRYARTRGISIAHQVVGD